MKKIKIFDTLFSHNPYSCFNCYSDFFEWDFNPAIVNDGDTVFFTETSFNKVLEFSEMKIKRVAWLIESPAIIDQNIIFSYIDIFDEIYTLRRDFLNMSPKFKFLPVWGSWIKYDNRIIYKKSKNLSIIASYKQQTMGHRLRHEVINKFGNIMDVFGSGYVPIVDKLEGLKDYMFSIVIENTKEDYYFTEKLMDCFTTGTIPIYWGCPSIGDFFNKNGIIIFDSLEELKHIIFNLSEEEYNNKLQYVNENFILANKYKCPEDYLINYSGIIK